MVEEWPVAAPSAADRLVERARESGGDRLATAMADFFLSPAGRLTEQERAVMTAMLDGLVGHLADELRVRVPDAVAGASDCPTTELVGQLSGAGLLKDEGLVSLLLRRADSSRVAHAADSEAARQFLSRLASDPNQEVARAAMGVALTRGRSRDRVRASLDLNDLDCSLAEQLVLAIAAALAGRSRGTDQWFVEAARDVLSRHDPEHGLEAAENRLVAKLAEAGRLDTALVLSLGTRGEASLLAHALAHLAGISPAEAWDMLVNAGEGQFALLLRLAEQPRSTAAALFVSIGPALGLNDAAAEIDCFDCLTNGDVESARRDLSLPTAYRRAVEALRRHG